MASERPIRTMAGARLLPEPHHTPVLASLMISSSMAALLWAHTSTRTGGMTPSFSADCAACAGRELLLSPAEASAESGARPCLATPPRPLPAARPPARWLSAAPSSADSMPMMAEVFPVPGGPWTSTKG